jgi:hypothetical protein
MNAADQEVVLGILGSEALDLEAKLEILENPGAAEPQERLEQFATACGILRAGEPSTIKFLKGFEPLVEASVPQMSKDISNADLLIPVLENQKVPFDVKFDILENTTCEKTPELYDSVLHDLSRESAKKSEVVWLMVQFYFYSAWLTAFFWSQ